MKMHSSLFSLPDLFLKIKNDPTSLSLLFSNLLTIFLAVLLNWNLMEILWVYWGQSVIIGVFNFFKILKISVSKNTTIGFKVIGVFLSFFFLIHYGGFHLAYLIFLFVFSFLPVSGFEFFVPINISVFAPFFLTTMGIFFINHLFSFLYYSKKVDAQTMNEKNILTGNLMYAPYLRIIPMHLTIIFGTMIMSFGMFNFVVLVLFLFLKTFADLKMHISEHKEDF